MYRTAKVVKVQGSQATVLFTKFGIQTEADIMRGVTVSVGDTAIVLSQDGFSGCVVIGVKEG